ncbi:MAG: antifreeze protein [Sulfitobacter sp.]
MFPQDIFALQMRMTTMMVEAQSVMMLRLMGMGGMIPAHRGENNRMVAEKGPAMAQAFFDATDAMIAGKTPSHVFDAALSPVSDQVRANRRRLAG